MVRFECLKCGDCCKNLLRKQLGYTVGLHLFSHETKHFPEEYVSPHNGIGLSEDWSSLRYVLDYQINVDMCPHVSEKNECRIYRNRPLACRTFPITLESNYNAISHECRFVKENNISEESFVGSTEMKSLHKEEILFNEIMRFAIKNRSFPYANWFFDLKTKSWMLLEFVRADR